MCVYVCVSSSEFICVRVSVYVHVFLCVCIFSSCICVLACV